MRFLLDENFPKAAVAMLRSASHEVFDVRGTDDEGMEDDALFLKAQEAGAVLLTTDRDFFHTVPHLHDRHCGVVVIALRQPPTVPRFFPVWNGRSRTSRWKISRTGLFNSATKAGWHIP